MICVFILVVTVALYGMTKVRTEAEILETRAQSKFDRDIMWDNHLSSKDESLSEKVANLSSDVEKLKSAVSDKSRWKA